MNHTNRRMPLQMRKLKISRRLVLQKIGKAVAGILAFIHFAPSRATSETATNAVSTPPKSVSPPYDPKAHYYTMAINVEKCIGCGLCVQACKTENRVIPKPFYFRTWIERYIIKKPRPGSIDARGQTLVDSPNGGLDGFPPSSLPKDSILRSFYVPKLCNQCTASPCVQACPVGATFDTPDGAVLVDEKYCIGCAFCIQACPYGCRFFNPEKRTAEKCSFCYHRITQGLKPACVEVCPTGSRIFADLKNPSTVEAYQQFIKNNKVQVLKPHLGTHPKVLYAGLDKEVS